MPSLSDFFSPHPTRHRPSPRSKRERPLRGNACDLPNAEQFDLAKGLREITDGRPQLFINDSGSISQAARADGVHLADCREPSPIKHACRWRTIARR